jgi:tRNA(Ile)-lysidine synthase
MLTRFVQNIKDKKLFAPSDRLLLAVSGGVDSVVLCELCYNAGFSFEIAHANFQLRGEESTADEHFVKNLAAHYRVPLHVKKFDTNAFAEKNKLSVQVAARQLRYNWFTEILKGGSRYVLTAHHSDDNVETVLMNFFRGTGISGLRGIPGKHNEVVRPLLPFSRKEILEYARERKLNWREDSSNASDKYSRNYFRNAIIPMVYKIFPEVESNLTHNIQRFAEIEELYHQAIDLHKNKILEYHGNEVHIPVLKLKKSKPLHTILYEIIAQYNFTSHQLNDVVHLLDAGQGKYVQSSTHRIFRNRNWLIISPLESEKAKNILITEEENEVNFSDNVIELKSGSTDPMKISGVPAIAEVDKSKIKFPLYLRKWKAGDYFYPLGMKKKKKISRFLIDQKLSPTDKEKVWVIESDKRICWVVGMRIDERFKVVPSTKSVIKFKVRKKPDPSQA